MAGDFNSRIEEKQISEFSESYKNAYLEGMGVQPNKTSIFGAIDYIFYKGEAELQGYLTLDFEV